MLGAFAANKPWSKQKHFPVRSSFMSGSSKRALNYLCYTHKELGSTAGHNLTSLFWRLAFKLLLGHMNLGCFQLPSHTQYLTAINMIHNLYRQVQVSNSVYSADLRIKQQIPVRIVGELLMRTERPYFCYRGFQAGFCLQMSRD